MLRSPADVPTTGPTRRALLLAAGCAAIPATATSRRLDPPTGPVVLTVSGRIATPNAGDAADFDIAMLAALPQRSFTTKTPWYSRPRQFTGPLMRDVLSAVGASGATLRLGALNDYRVDVPWDDVQQNEPIVARLIDGQPMSVRDKGPLFAIYPFDDRPALRGAVHYSRSAWQLRTIQVL